MKYGLYHEIQLAPPRTARQTYLDHLELIDRADALGYETYTAVEHFFFPSFSISVDPLAFFSAAAQRTEQIRFRTMMHAVPYHHPLVLASRIAQADVLTGGRYEFGLVRGHGWLPPRAGIPLDENLAPRHQEAVELLLLALREERFSYHGKYFEIEESGIVPRPLGPIPMLGGGASEATIDIVAKTGMRLGLAPVFPLAMFKPWIDLYLERCEAYGTTPDMVYNVAAYIDTDRDRAIREAEESMLGFFRGNCSPLRDYPRPPDEELHAAGYAFYTTGMIESIGELGYDQIVEEDRALIGAPDDVAAKIGAALDQYPQITEVALSILHGNVEQEQALKSAELFAKDVMPNFAPTAA